MQNNRLLYLLSSYLLVCITLTGQEKDSLSGLLKEVTITAYFTEKPVLRSTVSAAVIDSSQIQKQNGQSLVPVLNTVPGVRMEERSPGSYRLSIRGSLIRSPFGIRNTKVYMDEFPLTNAGGETYLNLIDVNSIYSIEILKGPDGSLFGANSGGVVKILPVNFRDEKSHVSFGAGTGSYGLFQENLGVQIRSMKNTIAVHQSWQRSDGYRDHSGLDRKYLQLTDKYNYNEKAQLRFLFFYSDLKYETPGGLTLLQAQQDPQMPRPPSGNLRGAAEQNAGVHNRTFYGGILHEYKFTERFRHVVAVFGNHTLFKNPFITNYEIRNEDNTGFRTWFELRNKNKHDIQLTFYIGAEGQIMQSHIANYDNSLGLADSVQAIDNMRASQAFAFLRFSADFHNKWLLEVSLSYNLNRLVYAREEPIETPVAYINFTPQFMPRLAASYLINHYISVRAVVSRGYSPPALQEIRASDNTINTSLEPESGWNYELGTRIKTADKRLWWDASVYYYQLDRAIVRRVNTDGNDYFVNSGGTIQPGFESQLTLQIIKSRTDRFIAGLQLSNAYAFQYYSFMHYRNGNTDYHGNSLTGVPRHISVTGITINFPYNLYLFGQYNYTAAISLNDANTVYAPEYHLVLLKGGWRYAYGNRLVAELCVGIDNLLQQSYSLGNDLNAAGGRYYNPAPGFNFFTRMNIWF